MNEKILSLQPKLVIKKTIQKPVVDKKNTKAAPENPKEQIQTIAIPEQNMNANTRELANRLMQNFKSALNSNHAAPKTKIVMTPTPQPQFIPPKNSVAINNKNQLRQEQEKQEQLKKVSRQRQEELQKQIQNKPQTKQLPAPRPITQPKPHPLAPMMQPKPKPRIQSQRDYELNHGLSKTFVSEFSSR